MKGLNMLKWVIFILCIFEILCQSQIHAKRVHPNLNLDHSRILSFINNTQDWSQRLHIHEATLKLSTGSVLTGVFSFLAASISSAGGIGGGGLYIPILTIVYGLDLKTATGFSAFMVTGGSIANVICNFFITSEKFGGKTLVDYDIALLSQPGMLLGVSIGVICNVVFPEWLITVLFAIFLAWSSFKTCRNGFTHWRIESEGMNEDGSENLATAVAENGNYCEDGEKSIEEPLLGSERNGNSGFPWTKLCILLVIWFSFFLVYLLRGNRYGKGIINLETCGAVYWLLTVIQIPLAVGFTAWLLTRKDTLSSEVPHQQGCQETGRAKTPKYVFPLMALLAGVLGGVFGIGGGMLISPLLLHVGVAPEITAATTSFMVFFSSTMSAFEYLVLGMENIGNALILSAICFAASLIGLAIVQKLIQDYGRASIIVFSVGLVMALSTVLMTAYGALDVWEEYKEGSYMGFNSPC